MGKDTAPSTRRVGGDEVEELTTAECWRLLERGDLGRLAVEGVDGSPDVFPVNYVVRAGHIYFRTAPGAKLAALVRSPAVAFEADGWEGAFQWSIVVRATASSMRLLDDAPLSTIAPAHPSDKAIAVRLLPSSISGRRFRDARLTTRHTTPLVHEPSDRKPVPIPHFPPPKNGAP